jgi:hypothetical protein
VKESAHLDRQGAQSVSQPQGTNPKKRDDRRQLLPVSVVASLAGFLLTSAAAAQALQPHQQRNEGNLCFRQTLLFPIKQARVNLSCKSCPRSTVNLARRHRGLMTLPIPASPRNKF